MSAYPKRAAARLSPMRVLPFTIALALAIPFAHANEPSPSIQALTERLQALERRLGVTPDDTVATDTLDLDQRLRVIERRLELQAEETAAKAAKDPVVSLAATRGLSVRSPEGLELKLRGLVQADARHFIGDDSPPQNDTFLFRRIRPTLEGTWGPLIGFRLTPEFAGDSATIVDAYIDLKFDPRATVRIGKVKGPVGLERLQSGGAIALVERGFPTELAPNRDIGVQLQGDLFGSRLSYVIGDPEGDNSGGDCLINRDSVGGIRR